jgi:hypothetical protein
MYGKNYGHFVIEILTAILDFTVVIGLSLEELHYD